jgi:hypothetical protein
MIYVTGEWNIFILKKEDALLFLLLEAILPSLQEPKLGQNGSQKPTEIQKIKKLVNIELWFNFIMLKPNMHARHTLFDFTSILTN